MPAKYEKSAPYSIGAIAKTKRGSGGLTSLVYKQVQHTGKQYLLDIGNDETVTNVQS